MTTRTNEKELIRQVIEGDEGAARDLFLTRFRPVIQWLAARYKYEDLENDVFHHLACDDYRYLRTFAGRSSLQSWVRQIALHLCLKRLQDESRLIHHEDMANVVDQLGLHTPANTGTSDKAWLLERIEGLKSEQERVLLRCMAFQWMDITTVANAMGITRQHADVIKHRAVQNLRKLIKELGEHE